MSKTEATEVKFAPILEHEFLSEDVVEAILRCGGPAITGVIDREFGIGKVGELTKAVWTKDGKRVTIDAGGGGFLIFQSITVDPWYAAHKRDGTEPPTDMER